MFRFFWDTRKPMMCINVSVPLQKREKSHSDEDTSPKGLSVLNLSIFVVQPPCINFAKTR